MKVAMVNHNTICQNQEVSHPQKGKTSKGNFGLLSWTSPAGTGSEGGEPSTAGVTKQQQQLCCDEHEVANPCNLKSTEVTFLTVAYFLTERFGMSQNTRLKLITNPGTSLVPHMISNLSKS